MQHAIDWKVNLGVLVLLVVLGVSLTAVAAFLILPLALEKGRHSPFRVLYFIAIGLGYILVEIAFIQRFVLFLGHPTYALTVVIFLLMLSSGAGSLMSRRWILRTELSLDSADLDRPRPNRLLLFSSARAGSVGRAEIRVSIGNQRNIAGASRLRHGHAFPDRITHLSGHASNQRRGRTRQGQRCGMGLGYERGCQRAGFGIGHGDRHRVWLDRHSGLRGRGLPYRTAVSSGTSPTTFLRSRAPFVMMLRGAPIAARGFGVTDDVAIAA